MRFKKQKRWPTYYHHMLVGSSTGGQTDRAINFAWDTEDTVSETVLLKWHSCLNVELEGLTIYVRIWVRICTDPMRGPGTFLACIEVGRSPLHSLVHDLSLSKIIAEICIHKIHVMWSLASKWCFERKLGRHSYTIYTIVVKRHSHFTEKQVCEI